MSHLFSQGDDVSLKDLMLPLKGLDTEQVRARVSSSKSPAFLINLLLDVICLSGTQKSEEYKSNDKPYKAGSQRSRALIAFSTLLILVIYWHLGCMDIEP